MAMTSDLRVARVFQINNICHLKVTDIVNFLSLTPFSKNSDIAQTLVNIGPNPLAQLNHYFGTAFATSISVKRRSVDCRRSG